MKTTYSVPDELKESIEKYAAYFIGLMPGWVSELYIDFRAYAPLESGSGGTRATVTPDYAYRRVYLTIYPAWLNDSESSRRVTIVHEAVHVLNAPLASFIEQAIKAAFGDDETITKVLAAQWRVANEAATEDTTKAILSVIADHEATEGVVNEQPETTWRENEAG